MKPHEQLESEFGEWSGFRTEQMVACSSGTTALHLALEALQLPPLSRVLVPDYTMVACARAVTMAGSKPEFIDCGKDLLLNHHLLNGYDSQHLSAIMPVHIYGRRCNMSRIVKFARSKRLFIIEDIAEAHGIKPHSQSDAACWSFYKNKIVAGQEGGMIAFRNPEHAVLAKWLRCLGFTDKHDFTHVPRGINGRLSDVHAELVLASLANAEENLKRRQWIERWYNESIGLSILLPEGWRMPARDVCWVYDLRLRGVDTTAVVQRLNERGVDARLGFKPMREQQEYGRETIEESCTHQASREIIYLPVSPKMSASDVDSNVRALREAIRH